MKKLDLDDTMPQPPICFTNVRKSFGRVTVLDGVDFEVPAGQFLGLAGVNGAGKTTLLKCLLDFVEPDSGEIRVHGVSFRQAESRSRLTFLPERFIPPYFLTGLEFLRLMLEFYGVPFDRQKVEALVDDLDLARDAIDKPVRLLSKGMTQKLGLAVCFLSQRDIYILDEPMSGLDPKARVRVKRILTRLRDEGKTLLFTSHSLPDIEEICDHMVILHKGAVAWQGLPAELRRIHGEESLERAFLQCIEPDSRIDAERNR